MTVDQRILTALRLLPPPLTSPMLARMLSIRLDSVCHALTRMADEGRVKRCGHDLRSRKARAIVWSAA
ncbi:MAG: hypothetical protein ACK5LJ_09450 [Paracoccus sp. (in: a-proteobacteria)]